MCSRGRVIVGRIGNRRILSLMGMGLAADFLSMGVFSLRMGVVVCQAMIKPIHPFSVNRRGWCRIAPHPTVMLGINVHISL